MFVRQCFLILCVGKLHILRHNICRGRRVQELSGGCVVKSAHDMKGPCVLFND
jgi:hypothetical protein